MVDSTHAGARNESYSYIYLVVKHPESLHLRLKSGVLLTNRNDRIVVSCEKTADGVLLGKVSVGMRTLLEELEQGGCSSNELLEHAVEAGSKSEISHYFYLLMKLQQKALLSFSVSGQEGDLVTLEPMSPTFCFMETKKSGLLRMSRFACIRWDRGVLIAESPLGYSRILFHNATASLILTLLATPRHISDLASIVPMIPRPSIEQIVNFLVDARLVFSCNELGEIAEEKSDPLLYWEFHDLFFHARSRPGRHSYKIGATFRFADDPIPNPLISSSMPRERVSLDFPIEEVESPLFYNVLRARRTRREPGINSITLKQLEQFLRYSARIQSGQKLTEMNSEGLSRSLRTYPNGGGIYELELYLLVTRCAGLRNGFYYYNPIAHELERMSDFCPEQKSMIDQAMAASGIAQPPDVLVTISAKFSSTAWKYEGLAYALIQKNVGALYQTMYLVATALNLAPCALGSGDSDLFSAVAGIDYFTETSVGEFMLSAV